MTIGYFRQAFVIALVALASITILACGSVGGGASNDVQVITAQVTAALTQVTVIPSVVSRSGLVSWSP